MSTANANDLLARINRCPRQTINVSGSGRLRATTESRVGVMYRAWSSVWKSFDGRENYAWNAPQANNMRGTFRSDWGFIVFLGFRLTWRYRDRWTVFFEDKLREDKFFEDKCVYVLYESGKIASEWFERNSYLFHDSDPTELYFELYNGGIIISENSCVLYGTGKIALEWFQRNSYFSTIVILLIVTLRDATMK